MSKLVLVFESLLVGQPIFSQDSLPTIKATSTKVDIRVGDDFFMRGGWIIDSTKKPDLFTIGSQWKYKTKKVTFITDLDSISFEVESGKKYNFIILLNGNTPCYTQIKALTNPIFMDKKIILPILCVYALLFILFCIYRNQIYFLHFLYFGYAAPTLFRLMTFASGLIHGNYNHLKNVVSELGAVETKSEIFTSTFLIIISILGCLFSIGFYKASTLNCAFVYNNND